MVSYSFRARTKEARFCFCCLRPEWLVFKPVVSCPDQLQRFACQVLSTPTNQPRPKFLCKNSRVFTSGFGSGSLVVFPSVSWTLFGAQCLVPFCEHNWQENLLSFIPAPPLPRELGTGGQAPESSPSPQFKLTSFIINCGLFSFAQAKPIHMTWTQVRLVVDSICIQPIRINISH